MVEISNAVRTIPANGELRSEALEHWQSQERAALEGVPAEALAGDRDMASGWWILPVLVLSLPAWAALLIAIL